METTSIIFARGSSMHGKCQAKTVRYVKLLTEGRASAYSKAHRMARQNDTDALSPPASRTASLAVRNLCSRTLWARAECSAVLGGRLRQPPEPAEEIGA